MKPNQERFLIKGLKGKKTLKGKITVGGAKNAALKLFAAALLPKGEVIFENVPDIEDIRRMAELIVELGGEVERLAPNTYRIDGREIKNGAINPELAKRFRASVVLIGPLLARFGKVELPQPGGDVLGKSRPIDFFINAFGRMGAKVIEKDDGYIFSAPKKLKGAKIFFPFQTVTGTEAALMAATLAEGTTTIKNAAMEPEIADLANFLNLCGASVSGAGTPTIIVEGKKKLTPPLKPYRIMPDRLEAGSFLILGALAADELEIAGCVPEHIESLFELLSRSGVKFTVKKDSIIIKNNGATPNSKFKAVNIRTHEYPGFPTDLQAPMTVFLSQVSGESSVQETIFDGRLNYTEDLVRMGADIKVWNPHRVAVVGPSTLHGRELESPDIRAGLAYLWAAIIAEGESIINNVHHIDRGYERIEKRLRNIGVRIDRVR